MRAAISIVLLAGCYRAPEQCELNANFECESTKPGVDAYDFWPFVVELFPPDDAKLVPLGITPSVKFTEQVSGVSSTTFVLSPVTGDPIGAQVDYDGATRIAALRPAALLQPSTQYIATLSADIVDLTGNALYGKRTWTFKTMHDTTSPQVMATSPSNGATNVPVDAEIVAEFSEQVSHVTLFTFYVAGAPSKLGYVSPTAVKLTPSSQLEPHTLYTATLTSAITDLIGNPLVDAPVSWTFTTGDDVVVPHVIMRSPVPDEVDVATTSKVTVQFDEQVVGLSTGMTLEQQDGAPIAATLDYDALQRRAKLTATLQPNTTYTVKLSSAIRDTSGNTIVPANWIFTTAP